MQFFYAVFAGLLLAAPAKAADAPPAFAKRPTAVKTGDLTKIDFAVNRATDVALTVEDMQGKVVRHLAAGVLGKNQPEPLQPNSFAQSLTWDGKDDTGKVLAGGPFLIRVRLGMKPEFDGFLMHNPEASGEI